MLSPRTLWVLLLSAASVVTMAGGCGSGTASGPPRARVSGKITLDGMPVTGGEIRFRPSQGAETSTLISSDGTYRIEFLDDSPVVGPNKVFIEWYRPTGKKDEDGNPYLAPAIPEKYNLNSILSVEIKADKNEHNFELQSK